MGALQPWHWIIVAIALLVLFGSKKLPDAARGLGRSMRIFKAEVREMQNEGKEKSESSSQAAISPSDSEASEAPRSSDKADVAERKSA